MNSKNPNYEVWKALLKEAFFLKPDFFPRHEHVEMFLNHDFIGLSNAFKGYHQDQFNITITHDIDWLDPWHPYSMIKSVGALAIDYPWLKPNQLKDKRLLIDQIQKLAAFEKDTNIQACYFIGSGSQHTFGRNTLRYNATDEYYPELIEILNHNHQSIGLHSNPDSIANDTLKDEKASLELLTGETVKFHRSHYLMNEGNELYRALADLKFDSDFGFGYARQPGLKNEYPGTIRPIDIERLEVIPIKRVPLILMDNAYFDMSESDVMKRFRMTLSFLKSHNGSASIAFHPENMTIKLNLFKCFTEILHICIEEGVQLHTSP